MWSKEFIFFDKEGKQQENSRQIYVENKALLTVMLWKVLISLFTSYRRYRKSQDKFKAYAGSIIAWML